MVSILLEYSLGLCFNEHDIYDFFQIQLDKKRGGRRGEASPKRQVAHLLSPSDEKRAILSMQMSTKETAKAVLLNKVTLSCEGILTVLNVTERILTTSSCDMGVLYYSSVLARGKFPDL